MSRLKPLKSMSMSCHKSCCDICMLWFFYSFLVFVWLRSPHLVRQGAWESSECYGSSSFLPPGSVLQRLCRRLLRRGSPRDTDSAPPVSTPSPCWRSPAYRFIFCSCLVRTGVCRERRGSKSIVGGDNLDWYIYIEMFKLGVLEYFFSSVSFLLERM